MQLTISRLVFKSLPVVIALGAALIAGCHGTNYNTGYGNVFVTYTDVGGDFPSYVATVDSVTLTRTDGTVASGVSVAEAVDFVKIKNVAEMVSNTTIPIGTYTSATIIIDFTSAQVFTQIGPDAVHAKVVDSTGAAPTTVTLVITFDPANPLVIPQSGAQMLNLEFNMAAANRVDLSTSPPTVTIAPFVTANNNPKFTKLIRVRGPLVSYNSQESTYTVYVRPFLDEVNNLGSLSLFGTPTSAYVIDNLGFVGSAGINAVTNLGTGAITSALTTFTPDTSAGTFYTQQAYIGSGVESTVADRLDGTVIARSGNTLTVRGTTLSLRTGGFTYYPDNATVTLAAATQVTIDGQPLATGITAQDISVGQNIIALGQSTVSAAGVVSLDATAGRVRLTPTRAWGLILAGGVGAGTLDLSAIDLWEADAFNFAGTGTSTARDAEPASYTLGAGAIDLTSFQGVHVAVDGHAAPFGAAPPAFVASAVAAVTTLDSRLTVDFGANGTVTPFSSVSSSSVEANLTDPNLSTTHSLVVGPNITDLKALPATPTIVPATSVRPTFAIGSAAAGVSVYSSFASFVSQLDANAKAGKAVLRVVATGPYDPATNVLTASRISVVLK